ncbi:interferon-induced GTP-binding protein Mx [Fusarium austroafricanum]|uniref:Interferon-induced GTP-binding protein Mx n=1 Tax=Fusarium austroafricanum TaxID=2364996 RepID=A0A8H4NKE9_9HYPO|nr:interferon-induced GTP-binding protein Mx [Fusarium austroafricanum]
MSNTSTVPSFPLNGLLDAYAEVFDAVDSLQEAGLERELIPKLVVVGDQSSGKSSVLEAICKVPFPVHEGLCTRFPIELVQRKSSKDSIIITIRIVKPGPNKEVLNRFKRELTLGDSEGLAKSIQEASALILGPSVTATSNHHFSMNVLRITILGPDKYPITLVDLPGFFRSSTDNQKAEDRHLVERIAAPYLGEPRNGLLLIMKANTGWATQTAPSHVVCPNVDPDGKRTLGIFTHLDNMDSSREVMDRFSGQTKWNPSYGWHGLKNLSDEERESGYDRDEVERDFFKKRWPKIEDSCKGIANLLPRLSEVLAKQIRLYLGDLINEVKTEIKDVNAKIHRLGERRTTEQEQRKYLSEMAGYFQELSTNAVSGRYGDGTVSWHLQGFFYDTEEPEQRSQDKRLQAVVRALGQQFVSAMIEKGKKNELHESESSKKAQMSSSFLGRLADIGAEAAEEAATIAARELGQNNDIRASRRSERDRSLSNRSQVSKGARRTRSSESESQESDNSELSEDLAIRKKSKVGEDSEDEECLDHGTSFSPPSFLREEILKKYNSFESPIQTSFSDFETDALAQAAGWRGTESLDDVNPAMVSNLYRDQTSRWRSIAYRHLEIVWESVTRFVRLALEHCVDPSVLLSLEGLIINDRLDKLRLSAETKLEELLRCHEGTNPAFHDFLREFQDESLEFSNRIAPNSFYAKKTILSRVKEILSPKVLDAIMEKARQSGGDAMELKTMFASLLLSQVKEAVAGQLSKGDAKTSSSSRYLHDKERGAVRRSILMIERYYKLSLISFISYVNALVIHNGLLDRVPSEIFSHNIVSEQTAKTIAGIAGEKSKDAKMRLDCEKKLGILKEALNVLESFRDD